MEINWEKVLNLVALVAIVTIVIKLTNILFNFIF